MYKLSLMVQKVERIIGLEGIHGGQLGENHHSLGS